MFSTNQKKCQPFLLIPKTESLKNQLARTNIDRKNLQVPKTNLSIDLLLFLVKYSRPRPFSWSFYFNRGEAEYDDGEIPSGFV